MNSCRSTFSLSPSLSVHHSTNIIQHSLRGRILIKIFTINMPDEDGKAYSTEYEARLHNGEVGVGMAEWRKQNKTKNKKRKVKKEGDNLVTVSL